MWNDFIESANGQRALHLRRELRTIRLRIDGVEPSGKKGMPIQDKVTFQQEIAEQLRKFRRQAFRGPIALDIWTGSSGKTPSHIHNVAKNLLDLLGKPDFIHSKSNALLFKDDSQVHGLSIRCDHGCSKPFIWVTASPFSGIVQSLHSILNFDIDHDEQERFDPFEWQEKVDELRDLESFNIDVDLELGNKLRSLYRAELQHSWLKGNCITPIQLGLFYASTLQDDKPWSPSASSLDRSFSRTFHISPHRILLPELPQLEGQSEPYHRHVKKAFEEYRLRFGKQLTPMITPLAIEVLVKPPPTERQRTVHDLDNVCRNYLVPKLVEIFAPPHALPGQERPIGPGLTRYEAWRIPRSAEDNSPGFVSVSLVSELYPAESLLTRIARAVDKVLERLE